MAGLPGRPTLNDVAKIAGVSRTTVWSILKKHQPHFARYTSDTIERVEEAARQVGYGTDVFASSLRSGRSPFFGVSFQFISDWQADPLSVHPTAMWEIFRGIARASQARGRYPVFLTGPDDELYARDPAAIDQIIRSGLSGMIISADAALWNVHVDRWEEAGVPCVSIFKRASASSPQWFVDLDNRRVGSLAWEYLYGKGHRNALCVWDHRATPAAVERIRGFREAQLASGRRLACVRLARGHVLTEANTRRDEALLMETMKRTGATAIFAATGGVSGDVVTAFSRRGVRVPEDCSVLTIDPPYTLPEFVHLAGWMTEIACPGEKLGREAANLLARRVEGECPEPTGVLVAPVLIERQSVAAI